jgi:putative transposase
LKAYADGGAARPGFGSWMAFYNTRRPRQAVNNQTPLAVRPAALKKIEAATRPVDMPLRVNNANASLTGRSPP